MLDLRIPLSALLGMCATPGAEPRAQRLGRVGTVASQVDREAPQKLPLTELREGPGTTAVPPRRGYRPLALQPQPSQHLPRTPSPPPSTCANLQAFSRLPILPSGGGPPKPLGCLPFPSLPLSARPSQAQSPQMGLRHPQASCCLATLAIRPPPSPCTSFHGTPSLSCLSRHDWLPALSHPTCLPPVCLQVLRPGSFPFTESVPFKTVPLSPIGPPHRPLPVSLRAPAHVRTSARPLRWSSSPAAEPSGQAGPRSPPLAGPGRSAAPTLSLNLGTLPSSTFSTLNPSQQSPGSSQAPGTGGYDDQWGAPAAAEAPPIDQMLPMAGWRRDFRCPGEGGGSELLWCGALGGRRPGGPGAAAGLGEQPSGCRGGAGRTCCGARAPRVRGRAPHGEAAPPRGSCPAASLLRSRKKAGAGGGPRNLLATRARSPRGAAPPWDALPDAPVEA